MHHTLTIGRLDDRDVAAPFHLTGTVPAKPTWYHVAEATSTRCTKRWAADTKTYDLQEFLHTLKLCERGTAVSDYSLQA